MAPDFNALARAIVTAAGRMGPGGPTIASVCDSLARDLAAAWPAVDQPGPLSCYFCDHPAVTIEAGYATCEPMFHESMRRRIEAVPPPEPADYSCPDWSVSERHRHSIGAKTWEHAHDGGHEAHSPVSHDLSDAEMVDYDEDEAARIVALGGEHGHVGGTA